jgi:hypothetical protein
VKTAIRLYEVPAEFREQVHDMGFVCQHLYSKVAAGTKIPNEEIGCIGFLSDCPGDAYPGVLCLDCEKLPNVRFEILPWPIQRGPIEETALFKDTVKE